MRTLIALTVVLALAGCGSSSHLTGPTITSDTSDEITVWHGAVVTGDQRILANLNAAWPQLQTRWPRATLRGWEIEGVSGLLPVVPTFWCGSVLCKNAKTRDGKPVTTLRGTTDTDTRKIRLSVEGTAVDAAWELCNAGRWILLHQFLDIGCGDRPWSQS